MHNDWSTTTSTEVVLDPELKKALEDIYAVAKKPSDDMKSDLKNIEKIAKKALKL